MKRPEPFELLVTWAARGTEREFLAERLDQNGLDQDDIAESLDELDTFAAAHGQTSIAPRARCGRCRCCRALVMYWWAESDPDESDPPPLIIPGDRPWVHGESDTFWFPRPGGAMLVVIGCELVVARLA
jgi:hypothetical protein